MKFAALLLLFAASSCAQPLIQIIDPLAALRAYLTLSPAQVEAIRGTGREYDLWVVTKRERLAQVQREIQEERSRPALDSAALGVRMVEIEAICRELAARLAEHRKQLLSLLTEPQRIRMTALEDAMKLAPVIQEAQRIRLLPESGASSTAAIWCSFPGPAELMMKGRQELLAMRAPRLGM